MYKHNIYVYIQKFIQKDIFEKTFFFKQSLSISISSISSITV